MKRYFVLAAAALLLNLTGCGEREAESSSAIDLSAGLRVICEEDTDPAYGETLKQYFKAIEQQDFKAYQQTVYPLYFDAYQAYLSGQGKTVEGVFPDLHARFDEDGYDGWTFTELYVNYYKPKQAAQEPASDAEQETAPSVDYGEEYLQAYVDSGVIDEETAEQTRKDAAELRNVQFSLYALYDGDEEDVQVLGGKEILMLKTADGCYLFG